MAQVVESLPSKHKALSSTPVLPKNQTKQKQLMGLTSQVENGKLSHNNECIGCKLHKNYSEKAENAHIGFLERLKYKR
jgi:hypothetical protein